MCVRERERLGEKREACELISFQPVKFSHCCSIHKEKRVKAANQEHRKRAEEMGSKVKMVEWEIGKQYRKK